MKVLLTCASFALEYGGPAYSVRTLASHLCQNGLTVAIWAPDSSAVTGSVERSEQGPGGRLPRELSGSLSSAIHEFGIPDVFHDSGLWWRHNWEIASAAADSNKPLVVSPRGMLEPAALGHHAWRKRVAWLLYQKRILKNAAALHVTSTLEARSVCLAGVRTELVTIPNGLTVPAACPEAFGTRQKTIVFVGRLHPIKGLPMLLEAWARIRPAGWLLVIAGPDEANHRQELEVQAKVLRIDRFVQFTGGVNAVSKQRLLRQASVFVLPSHSESFGVAAGEALAAGLPVIATRGTPWEALVTERCGWHVCASVDGLEAGLRAALEASTEELAAMGRRGHAFVARTYSWSNVADEMSELYYRICARWSPAREEKALRGF